MQDYLRKGFSTTTVKKTSMFLLLSAADVKRELVKWLVQTTVQQSKSMLETPCVQQLAS